MTTLTKAIRAAVSCAVLAIGTAAPQAARAADKVIAGRLGGQAPLWRIYVAVHKGFFKAEDIDLELSFAQSGAAATQQLTAGSLDVALSVGITDPIHAIDKGAPVALKKGDYEIISAGVAAARFAALKAGVVDAAIVLPPLNFVAENAGFVTLGPAADYVKDPPVMPGLTELTD